VIRRSFAPSAARRRGSSGGERSMVASLRAPSYTSLDRRSRSLGARRHRTEVAMRKGFNVVMRVVSTLLGVLMVAMGLVWMLQGLDLAFRVGFMVGDYHWTIYGAILSVIGIAQAIWSNTRQVNV
jgi:uncharacterized membrane protein